MKPKRLILHNFGSHIHSDIVFEDETDLVGVIGRWANSVKKSNGSGKSTFVDAIIYALYNKSRVSGSSDNIQELIREGQTDMQVTYDFEYNNQSISIEKLTNITPAGKMKNKFRVWVNGERKSETPQEGKAALQEVYDIEYDIFMATAFFAQGKSDEFINATSSEKQEYLRKIDKEVVIFEKAKQLIALDIDKNQKNINVLEAKIEVEQNTINDIDPSKLNTSILQGKDAVEEQQNKILKLEKLQQEFLLNKINIEHRANLYTSMSEAENRVTVCSSNIDSLKSNIKKKEEEIENIKSSFNKMVMEYDHNEYLSLQNNVMDIKEKVTNLKSIINNFTNNISPRLEKLNHKKEQILNAKNCVYCGGPLPEVFRNKQISEVQKEIDDILSKHDIDIDSSQKKLSELELEFDSNNRNLNNLQVLEDRFNKYQRDLVYVDGVNELINNYREQLLNTELEKGKATEDIKKYFSELEKISVKEDIIDQTENINLIREKIERIKEGVTTDKILLQNRESAKQKLSILFKEKEEGISTLNKLKCISNGFGKDGIPYLITQNTLQTIEDHANNILQEIGTGMEIEFLTQKETKKGTILQEVGLIIRMNNVERNYKTYSGGEKTIINFAVRMAISVYLTNKTQNSIEMVILDEVFASLDEENRHKIFGMLNVLKSRFNKIIAISHTGLRDIFQFIIEFERNEDGTKMVA
jgi:exonuclease SbcC